MQSLFHISGIWDPKHAEPLAKVKEMKNREAYFGTCVLTCSYVSREGGVTRHEWLSHMFQIEKNHIKVKYQVFGKETKRNHPMCLLRQGIQWFLLIIQVKFKVWVRQCNMNTESSNRKMKVMGKGLNQVYSSLHNVTSMLFLKNKYCFYDILTWKYLLRLTIFL